MTMPAMLSALISLPRLDQSSSFTKNTPPLDMAEKLAPSRPAKAETP